MNSYKLGEDFETEGIFWFPESKEKRFAGIIKFSPQKGISLTIIKESGCVDVFGSMGFSVIEDDEEVSEGNSSKLNDRSHSINNNNILHGCFVGDRGGYVTLLGLTETNCSSKPGFLGAASISEYMNNLVTVAYTVDYLFIGQHFYDESQLFFDFASFNSTYLTEWMARASYTIGRESEGEYIINNRPENINVTVESLENSAVSINSLNWSNFQRAEKKPKKQPFDLIFHHIEWLNIRPIAQKSFMWYLEKIRSIQKLFSLFMELPVFLNDLRLVNDSSTRNKVIINIIFHQPGFEKEKLAYPPNSLIPFQTINQNLKNVFETYFKHQEFIDVVYDLIAIEYYYKDSEIVNKYLNVCRAFETYHQKFNQHEQYVPEIEYKKILDDLNEIIDSIQIPIEHAEPKNLTKLKDSLKSKIKYANGYTLRERLNDSFKGINSEIFQKLEIKKKNFAYRVVQTRNYYTHYSGKEFYRPWEGSDLLISTLKLALLLKILLLKDMGFQEQELIKSASDSLLLKIIENKNSTPIFGEVRIKKSSSKETAERNYNLEDSSKDELHERVMNRAYFHWSNRTGINWPNPLSNWEQAFFEETSNQCEEKEY